MKGGCEPAYLIKEQRLYQLQINLILGQDGLTVTFSLLPVCFICLY